VRSLIYVCDGKTYDRNDEKFDCLICFSDVAAEELEEECYYHLREFEAYIGAARPKRIRIKFETQEELAYLVDQICAFVVSLELIAKHSRSFDLTPLERCGALVSVEMYWNTKQERLWDVKKNGSLKHFSLVDYYKVADLSVFAGSGVEELQLLGCNGFSSFSSKMHVKDLSFLKEMPHLRTLHLDVIKDEESAYYLELLAACRGVTELFISHHFFTFGQFAWLKAHMPQVERGLEGVFRGEDFFGVLGKGMPKALEDAKKAERYQEKYDALVKKYQKQPHPPTEAEKG